MHVDPHSEPYKATLNESEGTRSEDVKQTILIFGVTRRENIKAQPQKNRQDRNHKRKVTDGRNKGNGTKI